MGNSQPSRETVEQEESVPQENKTSEEYQAREKIISSTLEDIKKSLESDPSEANALLQYSKVLKLQNEHCGGINQIETVVSKAKLQWGKIDESLNEMKSHADNQHISDLKGLKLDYFSLLLETGVAIGSLVKQSEMQQRNVLKLQELVAIREQNDNLVFEKNKDAIMYEACMDTLKQFINQDKLEKVVKKWFNLCQKLEEKRSYFEKLYRKYQKQSYWKRVAIGIGGVLVVGAIATVIIAASCGTATPLATGLVGAVGKSAAIWVGAGLIGAAIGVTLVGGGIIYGTYFIPKEETLNKMKKITSMIEDMLKTGKKMQNMVTEQITIHEHMKVDVMANVALMKGALKNINDYLIEYAKQGNKTIAVVTQEIEKIIDE